MCPKLLQIGPFTVYSYGLMVAIGFFISSYFLSIEINRKQLGKELDYSLTIITLISGIIGSKLLYLVENWKIGRAHV